MESIRIKNLRSIRDSGEIRIKPLTIIIGKNGCGKSTLVRTLPLLKQSCLSRTSEPILWYGSDVDFGSFKTAISSSCKHESDCINFCFSLKTRRNGRLSKYFKMPTNISISCSLKEKHLDALDIIFDKKFKFSFKYDCKNNDIDLYDFFINGESLPHIKGIFVPNRTSLIPSINFYEKDRKQGEENEFFFLSYSLFNRIDFYEEDIDYSLKGITNKILRISSNAKNDLKRIQKINDQNLEVLAKQVQYNCVEELLALVRNQFISDVSNIVYFKPLRAQADRFYRVQGISVDEINSDGANAAMILHSMSPKRLKDFEKWCEENFGFVYSIDNSLGDNTSIVVKNTVDSTDAHNLTDTGFGYSQVLPIILSLWNNEINTSNVPIEKTFVMEQPELHLHPAFQKRLMRTLIGIINNAKDEKNKKFSFVLETHSETIINYVGKMIAKKILDLNDVNLLICDKINGESIFKQVLFDEQGLLKNWPSGFFTEE